MLPGYTILRTLGHGGFAVVYLARQESLNREVAVKVLRRDVEDPRAWRRFRREAHTVARLSGHPNVVTVYTVSRSAAGQPCLVTEFLDRGSLAGIIATEGGLAPSVVVQVGIAIADALAAAHELGILHRDVKPANVLLGDHGRVKLGDFGIARLLAAQSAGSTTDVFAFTPEHVAPEVLRGEPDGPWSDVYGLASTLAQAVIGAPLFTLRPDERVDGLLSRKVAGPPPSLPASVPGPLADLITRGLQPDPAHRPSLTQFRDRLAAMADDRGSLTTLPPPEQGMEVTVPTPTLAAANVRPVDSTDPSRNRRRRHVHRAPLAVAAVFVALIALTVALATLRDSDDDASGASLVTQPSGGPVAGASSAPTSAAPLPTAPTSSAATTAPATVLAPTSPSTAAPTSLAPTAPSTSLSTAPPAPTEPVTAAPPATATAFTAAPPAPATPAITATSLPAATVLAAERAVATAVQADAFLRSYYDAVGDGNYEVSWSQLAPEFQLGRARSYEYYVEFWNDNDVQVADVRFVSADATEVILDADLRWNGSTSVVTNRFTLRPGQDGELLIAREAAVDAS